MLTTLYMATCRLMARTLPVLVAALVGVSLAQLSAAAQDTPQSCALVCVPPESLDAEKCQCVQSESPAILKCTLVCLSPGEVLDPVKCRCVTRP